jgi:hypothetical protein
MSGFLVERTYPGATTCIVIGGLAGCDTSAFGACRHVLWWAHEDAASPALAGAVERVALSAPDPGAVIDAFLRRDPRHLPSLYVTHRATDSAYAAVLAATHAALESAHRTRVTRQKDGFVWQRHVLQNAPGYVRQRLPAAWAGALRGLPAFVCGAGPSLDVSILPLAGAANRAVIFAADSALRALARHGVQADFAVSIDAAKVPDKCLPPDCPPARVVLASVSPPAWQTALPPDRQFFISGAQLTDDWLATQGAPRTTLAVAESCGSTALELARHLGCDPIYLFGLDLAVNPANQARRHQQDADPGLYTQSNYDPTAALPRVPGNYVETVPCFALGDWSALDARLGARTGGRIFNVTDRGARLRGTTLVAPAQFSLAAAAGAKQARLDRLAGPTASPPAVLTRLRIASDRCAHALPGLRATFAQSGPPALAAALRSLVLDPECGRALGAFALKLMPHLVPPTEGDTASWQTLLDEFAELAGLMRSVTEIPPAAP